MRDCSIKGCGKPHKALGYCVMHVTRLRRGQPLEGPPKRTNVAPGEARRCRKCGSPGPLVRKAKGSKHEFHLLCIECQNSAYKRRYAVRKGGWLAAKGAKARAQWREDPASGRARVAKYRRELISAALSYLGAVCRECGETDHLVLQASGTASCKFSAPTAIGSRAGRPRALRIKLLTGGGRGQRYWPISGASAANVRSPMKGPWRSTTFKGMGRKNAHSDGVWDPDTSTSMCSPTRRGVSSCSVPTATGENAGQRPTNGGRSHVRKELSRAFRRPHMKIPARGREICVAQGALDDRELRAPVERVRRM